jgi:anti-sigma factor RsiW
MTEPDERADHLPADLLADLDAGLLDPTRAAEVRAAAAQDPDARAVLAALSTTRAELGELADPPVPAEYAARWDAALAAAAAEHAAAPSPVRSLRARRRRKVRPALVAAAVLAAVVVGSVLWAPRAPAPMSLDGVDLVAAGLGVQGDFDVGDLADPARRAGCLRAVAPPGVAPDALFLGGRDVVLDGHDGVLLLLAAGEPGRLHIVVVAPDCGPDGGALLRVQTIGG